MHLFCKQKFLRPTIPLSFWPEIVNRAWLPQNHRPGCFLFGYDWGQKAKGSLGPLQCLHWNLYLLWSRKMHLLPACHLLWMCDLADALPLELFRFYNWALPQRLSLPNTQTGTVSSQTQLSTFLVSQWGKKNTTCKTNNSLASQPSNPPCLPKYCCFSAIWNRETNVAIVIQFLQW